MIKKTIRKSAETGILPNRVPAPNHLYHVGSPVIGNPLEITAARPVYNDRVAQWNRDIFDWPTKNIVAAKQGYTTRIPFTASAEVKDMARQKFF